MKIPQAEFKFGQRVLVTWHESECQPTVGTITGINYDHRRDKEPIYTITEDNGEQTDYIDENMISPILLREELDSLRGVGQWVDENDHSQGYIYCPYIPDFSNKNI
jgi:hypothetical protein